MQGMRKGHNMPAQQPKVRQLQWKPHSKRPRLPSVDKKKGTAQGRRTYATKTTTRRSQQTRNESSGPRETSEGVAEAAQGKKYGPRAAEQRHEQQRQRGSNNGIRCLKGRNSYSQNPYRLPS